MQTTPHEVLQGQPAMIDESTVKAVKALPTDQELDALRQQRIRFDGFFTGLTW
ncbi:MAG: hypothetical protein ACXVGO_17285 [Mycobacterium sp.]